MAIQSSASSTAATKAKFAGPIRLTVAGAALLSALIAAGAALFLLNFRNHIIAENQRNLSNTALIRAKKIEQIFAKIDSVQKAIADQIANLDIKDAADFDRKLSRHEFHMKLRDQAAAAPLVGALTILNADGRIGNSSRQWPAPESDFSTRDYFAPLQSNPNLTSFIGKPVHSPFTQEIILPLVRQINGPNQEFIGLLAAIIELQPLRKLFNEISLDSESAIGLIRHDGMLLMRFPQKDVGHRFPNSIVLGLVSAADRGAGVTEGLIAGQPRLLAAHRVNGPYPIVVAASRTMNAVLSEWRQIAAYVAAGAILSIVASAGLFVRLFKNHQALMHARAEREIADELRKQSQRYGVAMNNISQGVVMIDASERVVVCNDRYLELYGLTREAVRPGMLLRELIEHRVAIGSMKGDPEEYYARIMKQIANRQLNSRFAETTDGRTIHVVSQPVPEGGWVTTHEDVTERKNIEAQLRQAQKMEAIGNLTGGVAHDFNNLLTVMIGNLDLLLEDSAAQPATAARVNAILDAALRGAELTKQMLAYSRRQPLLPKHTEVNALVEKTTRLLSRTLGERIVIDVRNSPDACKIMVDEVQLETAMVNIAINARDAMPNGGTLTVTTSVQEFNDEDVAPRPGLAPGKHVVLRIADTGVGMPAEVIGSIFEPFFTTKEIGKGSGLGLSMVYGFVKQSGGYIGVTSTPGKGTTFELCFPAVAAASAADDAGVSANSADQSKALKETVLVVDDQPEVLATAVTHLKSLGYNVLEADSAKSALEKLSEEANVDLLFTDIVMPGGLNGVELAQLARAGRPTLKVLYASGYLGTNQGDRSEVYIDSTLLNKPYRKQELATAVAAIMAAA